jgi:Tol biopolymer transport system component
MISLRRASAVAPALLTALALAIPAASAQRPGDTDIASLAWDGTEGNARSGGGLTPNAPAVSADGRFVAFESDATNLVPDDTNELRDLFVRDRSTGSTERVSIHNDGSEPARAADRPSISADGRFVAWESSATLTDIPTGGRTAVYVRDRLTGTTELASVPMDGNPPTGASSRPTLSTTGRYVAFFSFATNLVEGVTNVGAANVFVYDRETGETRRASLGNDGQEPDNTTFAAGFPSGRLGISADGRYVTFASLATNLVPDDTNDARDIFVRDLVAETTERVSVNNHGEEANRRSLNPSLSDDGRFIAFESEAHNLVPGWGNGQTFDVYVRDRHRGVTERVSIPNHGREMNWSSGYPQISGDGRYVVFEGFDDALAAGDGAFADVYVHDRHTRRTERVSVAADGGPANQMSLQPNISADGRYVVWHSRASNLGPGSSNGAQDVYIRDRGPEVGLLGSPVVTVDDDTVRARGTATFAGDLLSEAHRDEVEPSISNHTGERLTGGSVAYRPDEEEIVLRVGVHDIPVHAPAGVQSGTPGVIYGFSFTVDGVEHQVRATAVPTPIPTGARLRGAFTLMRCDVPPVCRPLSYQVGGGYGTSGQEVFFPVALDRVGGAEGSELTGLRAFSSFGELHSGGLVAIDEITLEDAVVPQRAVSLALGPRSADPSELEFSDPVLFDEYEFNEQIATAGHAPGPAALFIRICHGTRCSISEHPVEIPGTPQEIELKDTKLELTVDGQGGSMTLRARLTELDAPQDAIPGRTIDFYSDGELIGSDETDSDGIAEVSVPPGHRGANRTYEAIFEGDDFYRPSSGSRPGRGGGRDASTFTRQPGNSHRGLFML